MSRARNNFARLPYEIRRLVMRLLLDGAEYEEIRRTPEVARALSERKLALHGTTFQAVLRSLEYKEYKRDREAAEKTVAADFRAAEALRECAGISSVADMTQMMLLEQLRELARSGGDPAELLKLTTAVTKIKAADDSERVKRLQRQLDDLKRDSADAAEHAAARIAALEAENATLRAAAGMVDGSEVADALNAQLGV